MHSIYNKSSYYKKERVFNFQYILYTEFSCESQPIATINDFAKCLNEKGQCDVLLLDFHKAFDKVPHARLFQKLHHYGIRGTLLFWIKSLLTNRSQYEILDNQKSHSTLVSSGVPQGTVLAPLLFLLYIMIYLLEYALK